jgi:hypothetical protein
MVRPDVWVRRAQSPYLLAWRLWRRGKPFTAIVTVSFRGHPRLPLTVRRALGAMRIGARLAALRLRGKKRVSYVLDLPIKGQLALPTRLGGWKVFDLVAGQVTVQLAPQLPQPVVARHLQRVLETTDCPMAPAVLGVDVDQRRYAEQFVNGYPLPSPLRDWSAVRDRYLPVAADLLLSGSPTVADLGAYVDRRIEGLRRSIQTAEADPIVRSSALPGQIREFLDLLGAHLSTFNGRFIVLALSHGDFHGGNICRTGQQTYLIDWQNLDTRSAFFDVYTLLFRTLRPSRMLSNQSWFPDALTLQRMTTTVSELRALLARRSEEFAVAFADDVSTDVYRNVFYVEMLAKAGDKFGELTGRTAVLEHFDRTVAWIESFTSHESGHRALLGATAQ